MCYAAYQPNILPPCPQKSPWQYFDRKVLYVIKKALFSKEKDSHFLTPVCLKPFIIYKWY